MMLQQQWVTGCSISLYHGLHKHTLNGNNTISCTVPVSHGNDVIPFPGIRERKMTVILGCPGNGSMKIHTLNWIYIRVYIQFSGWASQLFTCIVPIRYDTITNNNSLSFRWSNYYNHVFELLKVEKIIIQKKLCVRIIRASKLWKIYGIIIIIIHTRSGWAKDATTLLDRGSQSFTVASQPPETTRFSAEQKSTHRMALSWLPTTVSVMTKATWHQVDIPHTNSMKEYIFCQLIFWTPGNLILKFNMHNNVMDIYPCGKFGYKNMWAPLHMHEIFHLKTASACEKLF